MPNVIIVNTSPLFYLHRIDCLHFLEKLYGKILVPEAVAEELLEGEKLGEDVPKLADYNWITVKKATVPAFISMVPDLGRGEAEVLALGGETHEPLLIIDDALARRIADLQAFKYTGTAGVLLKAKKNGDVAALKPLLEKLKSVGFYISDKIVADILTISGEQL